MTLQPKATKTGKKPAPSPYSKGNANKAPSNPLFEKRSRSFGIGMYILCLHMLTLDRPGHPASA